MIYDYFLPRNTWRLILTTYPCSFVLIVPNVFKNLEYDPCALGFPCKHGKTKYHIDVQGKLIQTLQLSSARQIVTSYVIFVSDMKRIPEISKKPQIWYGKTFQRPMWPTLLTCWPENIYSANILSGEWLAYVSWGFDMKNSRLLLWVMVVQVITQEIKSSRYCDSRWQTAGCDWLESLLLSRICIAYTRIFCPILLLW